jgi:hypothetical protein
LKVGPTKGKKATDVGFSKRIKVISGSSLKFRYFRVFFYDYLSSSTLFFRKATGSNG